MNSFWRSFLLVAMGLPLLLSLTGCPPKIPKAVRSRIPGASGETKLNVKVHVYPSANKNNPVAVDLVFVSDKKLLKELMKMSASEWFENRHQVQLDYPKETSLDAGSWEWVPGQAVKLDRVTVRRGVVGGVIFANYFNPGAHRAQIDPRKDFSLILGEDDLCIQSDEEVPKPCPPAKRFAHVQGLNDAGEAIENYHAIEDSFNQNLANRFPFASLSDRLTQPQLDPWAMIKFFRVLDEKEKAAREAVKRSSEFGVSAEQATAATAFLDQIDKVREFFGPLLERKQDLSFDFHVQFRVNREQEIGANQIIDWKLEVGEKKFAYLSDDLVGRWSYDYPKRNPIRLTLRWADNSPGRPVSSTVPVPYAVKDRTAIFEHDDPWSLFTLLFKHGLRRADAGMDCEQVLDPDPYTLKFAIKTEPDPASPPMQREDLKASLAEVFMRVRLMTANGGPLMLPCFPTKAPPIDVPKKTN